MALSRETIDRLIDEHFRYEATDDIDGVVASLADDARHEVIPSPAGEVCGRDAARAFYTMLFASLRGEGVTPLRRLYGNDFVVDETLWRGHVVDGRPFLLDGRSGDVSFRMLHVFEFEGERIKHEQVWCDLAAIRSQLGCAD